MPYARIIVVLAAVLMAAGIAYAEVPSGAGATPPPGRFQLVVVPDHPASPFMVDTATGCLWHAVQDEKTKRVSFTEVDVDNLHWSYATGAQAILAARIDAATLPDDQKNALKQNLQKTSCGQFNVTLTSAPAKQSERAPEERKPVAPQDPKKPKK